MEPRPPASIEFGDAAFEPVSGELRCDGRTQRLRPQTAAVLARLLVGYDRYYPAVQDIDGKAISAEADAPDTALDDRWGKLDIPVLLFVNTGMGADWVLTALYSAAHAGSKDVTFTVLEGYGHLDVLVGERAATEVFEPAFAWISARAQ